jgi:hypothetical protein
VKKVPVKNEPNKLSRFTLRAPTDLLERVALEPPGKESLNKKIIRIIRRALDRTNSRRDITNG